MRRIWKRAFIVLMGALLVFSLAACGNSGKEEANGASDNGISGNHELPP